MHYLYIYIFLPFIFTLTIAYNHLPVTLQCSLTWGSAYVDHITNDVLSVLLRLHPGHLNGGGWKGFSLHMGGCPRQSISPEHCEAGTGLCGASAVLSNALVDSFIILADGIYRQCAVRTGGKKKRRKTMEKLIYDYMVRIMTTGIWPFLFSMLLFCDQWLTL